MQPQRDKLGQRINQRRVQCGQLVLLKQHFFNGGADFPEARRRKRDEEVVVQM